MLHAEKFRQFGDYIDTLNPFSDLRETRGFNRYDKEFWPKLRVTEYSDKMARLLRKYSIQLVKKFGPDIAGYFTSYDAVCPNVKPTPMVDGSVAFVLSGPGLGPKFATYVALQKEFGLYWNPSQKVWFVPKYKIKRFDYDLYAVKIYNLGLSISAFPNPVKTFIGGGGGLPLEDAYNPEASYNKTQQVKPIPFKTFQVMRLSDGKFEIRWYPYQKDVNDLFSNNAGLISGITEYNPISFARETYSIELVLEALDKVKKIIPDWNFVFPDQDKVIKEYQDFQESLKVQIPEVVKWLDPKYALKPYQNEGVLFFEKTNGNALLGDEMGCISGDALITINRAGCARKITIKHLYKKFHGEVSRGGKFWRKDVLTRTASVDSGGNLRLNEIKNVLFKGTKKVLRLTVRAKKKIYTIDLTPDHEVMTNSGWAEAKDLLVGQKVAINGLRFCKVCNKHTEHSTYKYAKFKDQCRICIYRFSRTNKKKKDGEFLSKSDGYIYVTTGIRYHPRVLKNSNKAIGKHILVYEASKNLLSYEDYMRCVSKNKIEGFWFVPDGFHVHHKDGNRSNNDITNLECMSALEHAVRHSDVSRIPSMIIHYGTVVSIVGAGEKEVYDIVMADPHRNFVANGIVVHNCGKTLQTLAWVVMRGFRVLVVCPKNVRKNWILESKKFFPKYFKLGEEINKIPKHMRLDNFQIVSTNYERLPKIHDKIIEGKFDVLIVDEAHRGNNMKTATYKNVASVASLFKHKIFLSGTAVRNKKKDFFAQFEIIKPGLFKSKQELASMSYGAIWNRIQEVYLSRRKEQVLKDLPENISQIVEVPVDNAPDFELSKGLKFEEIARMKQEVSLAKAPATTNFVEDLLEGTESAIVVFSESVEVCKQIYEALGEDIAMLHHGQLSDATRESIKEEFQKGHTTHRVLITTRQSLAEGANLTRADRVVFNDLPWTAAAIAQAQARCHRHGSVNDVNSYWITIADNNFDMKIATILKKKYELCKKINEGKQVSKEEKQWLDNPVSIDDLQKTQ